MKIVTKIGQPRGKGVMFRFANAPEWVPVKDVRADRLSFQRFSKKTRQHPLFVKAISSLQRPLRHEAFVGAMVKVKTYNELACVTTIYKDGDYEVAWKSYPNQLYSVARKNVRLASKKELKVQSAQRKRKRIFVDIEEEREYEEEVQVQVQVQVQEEPKAQQEPVQVQDQVQVQVQEEQELHSYKKQATPEKIAQNTAFAVLLPVKPTVMILDHTEAFTTKALLKHGVSERKIYIAQPNIEVAAKIHIAHPKLKIFNGFAGDFIFNTKKQFNGVFLDYCGMPGGLGKKNSPMDDICNMFRYNKLKGDNVVFAVTVCARSAVKHSKKYESFDSLISFVQDQAEKHAYSITKPYRNIYTEQGHQTMCHYRCVLNKTH